MAKVEGFPSGRKIFMEILPISACFSYTISGVVDRQGFCGIILSHFHLFSQQNIDIIKI